MNSLVKSICGLIIGTMLCALSISMDAWAVGMNRPQLTVKSYEIINGEIEKCAECTLRVYIENVDNKNTAKSGMITLYSEKITPVTGKTNQIVFGEIKAGKSIAVDFDVNLDLIEKGPNVVEFALVWFDENFASYSTTLHIAPVLLEEVALEITSVNIPNTVYGNKNTTMSVYYENTGDENLRNLYMVVEGDIAQQKQVVELENLAAKGKKMVDYSLELLNEGNNRVAISLRYEDRNGNQYTSEIAEVFVNVTDKTYIEPVVEKDNFLTIMGEYKVFVVFGIVAVLLCIPFVNSVIKKGGQEK